MTGAPAIPGAPLLPSEAFRRSAEFRDADPFPHIVVDGLFDHGALQAASQEADVGALRDVCAALGSDEFVTFLAILTGIGGLEPEPGGARLVASKVGAPLGTGERTVGAGDAARHRRVSAYLFAGGPWRDEWGGHLEIWDGRARCARRVAPAPNALAVLATSPRSWHAHLTPRCPAHVARTYFAAHYCAAHPAQPGPRRAAPAR